MNTRKVSLLCLVLLLLSTAAHAKIVFSSERNGVKGVYVMDDDGSNQTVLIENEWRPFPTAWSPDGKQILFNSLIGTFLMSPEGTNVQKVKGDGYRINNGRFSPDGKYIVSSHSVRENGVWIASIYVLNVKTGKTKEIFRSQVVMANICDWSPDGKYIIFSEGITIGGGSNTIWIMGSGGQNPRPLIPTPGWQKDNFAIHRNGPRWSPDSQKIVFREKEQKWEFVPNVGNSRFFGAFRYMICDRNGTNIKQLKIPKDWECYGIDWMDDGESVVFSAREGIPVDGPLPRGFEWPPCYIYKYHIKTEKITQLTDDPGWDQTIDWISDDLLPVSPQGKKKVTWGELK